MKKEFLFLTSLIIASITYGQQRNAIVMTTMGRIEQDVQESFKNWTKKGEFEKTITYNERIAEKSAHIFDSLCEHYIIKYINKIDKPIGNWDITYNADEEVFILKHTGTGDRFNEFFNTLRTIKTKIPVSIEQAPKFKQRNAEFLVARPYGKWRMKNGYLIPLKILLYNNSNYDSITCIDLPTTGTKEIFISTDILHDIPQALRGHKYYYTSIEKFEKMLVNNNFPSNDQPITNPNVLFNGKGTVTGSGQAGNPDGSQGAQGGSGKVTGSGYFLGGRSLRGSLPVPNYTDSKDGDVVVRIKVDCNGNVVEVEAPAKGSKNYDNSMVEAAKQAAKKACFNADLNATEYQYGTITYKFRIIS